MYPINWTLVALLWLTYFLNYVDRQVIFSLLPALRNDIPMTDIQLGWIGSVFIWCYSLASTIGGRFADRYGAGVMVFASVLLFSGATLATGLSHSAPVLLTARAMLGVTEAFYFPAAVSLLGSLHASAVRSRVISLHGSAQFAGAATGGWLGGWMAEQFGWRSNFRFLAVAGVIWAAVLAPALLRGRRLKTDRSTSGRGDWSDLIESRYGALLAAFFALCAILWMLYAWLPLYLHEKFNLSLSDSGFKATIFLQSGSLAGILAGGVAGDWVSRYRAGRLLLASGALLASAPFAVWILAAPELWAASLAAVCFGWFSGIMMANNVAAAYDLIPARSYGLAAGVLTLVGGLAGGIAILFAGAWKDSYGIEFLMRWAAAAAAVSAIVLGGAAWRYSVRLAHA